ncbi:unnamed protein product [Mesocestoides corti]|uniref:Secreted protein n=1 Tax=Mesocestoides corti TaxID=53468 RepID=A0A0R3U884_MESCO|nr:unnamed protein product [Mesocestoides corti]
MLWSHLKPALLILMSRWPVQTRNYLSTHLPYAIAVGRHSRNLLFVYWERYWSMDIEELRGRLRVPPPPQVKKVKKFPA